MRRTPVTVRGLQWAPVVVERELPDAAARALAAGAKPPITYVGAGMTGIVFSDRHRLHAYKVARSSYAASMIANEAEWYRAAAHDPFVKRHIPRRVRWDGTNGVLIRTYVRGAPGGWKDEHDLFDLHGLIEARMLPRGWTSPEFKGDSYVFRGRRDWRGGCPILIDASMAHRVGKVLLRYAVDVATGRRPPREYESLSDLAFDVRREVRDETNPNGTVTPAQAARVLAILGT